MRLSPDEIRAIKESVAEADPKAVIYLYGSRSDDGKRGGDIDLMVLSDKIDRRARRKIKLKIYDRIGEQKIDLLVTADPVTPLEKIAFNQGVRL
ncbi:MAG: nucleotidyltransferase domain-containing protein [Candidatus Wallbacteria bacterium]|nr:nucleotidyltransferase domain-containing protein [Candidatus Wallbacteria bacterium]